MESADANNDYCNEQSSLTWFSEVGEVYLYWLMRNQMRMARLHYSYEYRLLPCRSHKSPSPNF